MKIINGVKIREPKNMNEKMLFSTLVQLVEDTKFGKIDLTLTIQDGMVMYIKQNIKKNIKLK